MLTSDACGTPATEVINAYGYPQTVDEDGSPICSGCGAAVLTNRGQGTICGSCEHEFTLHCSHDL